VKLRVFLGFVAGTVLNFIFFGLFATANGTPVPSVHSPRALLAYPTGSVITTCALAWLVYFFCLAVTCVVFSPRNSSAR